MFWLMIWREFNAIVSLLGLALVILRYVEFRRLWNDQERAFRRAMMMYSFATVMGSMYAVVKEQPFNLGIPFVTAASLMVVYAKLKKPKRLTGGR